MFNKIFLAACAIAYTCSAPVYAKDAITSPNGFITQICNEYATEERLTQSLNSGAGEIPLFTATHEASTNLVGDKAYKMVIYLNPVANTYTVIHYYEGMACLISYGKNVTPVTTTPEPEGDPA